MKERSARMRSETSQLTREASQVSSHFWAKHLHLDYATWSVFSVIKSQANSVVQRLPAHMSFLCFHTQATQVWDNNANNNYIVLLFWLTNVMLSPQI